VDSGSGLGSEKMAGMEKYEVKESIDVLEVEWCGS